MHPRAIAQGPLAPGDTRRCRLPLLLRRRPGQRFVIRDACGRELVEVTLKLLGRREVVLSIDARCDLEIDRCDEQPPPAAHAAAA